MFGIGPGRPGFGPTFDFNSVSFPGSSNYHIIGAHEAALVTTTKFSAELWIKYSTLPTVDRWLCTKKVSGSTNSFLFWLVYVSAGNYELRLQVADGADFAVAYKAITMSVSTWYHLGVTWDGTLTNVDVETEFYKDGSGLGTPSVGTAHDIASISDTSDPLRWGGYNTSGKEHDGLMAEMRFWSDIRSPTEISDNYNKHIDPSSANLECYIQLDGTSIVDVSDNAVSLTTTGLSTSTDVPF